MDESHTTVVDALMASFIATYGMPKLRNMWAGSSRAMVVAAWSEALARYRPEAIRIAAREMIDWRGEDGLRRTWPPSLPEFLDLVEPIHRRLVREEQEARALRAPSKPGSPLMPADKAREALRGIMAMAQSKVLR